MTNWATLGVQHSPATANKLLTAVGCVVANAHYRYVWRGHSNADWPLHSNIHRRLLESGRGVTNGAMVHAEVQLLRAARAAGYDVLSGRKLSSVELLALLQHEGAATEPGELTFEINSRRVDEIVTVTDEEIVEAMVFLFDRLKLVAEPSGAVGIAALLSGKIEARDRSVGVVLSGGNVGSARFAELVARASASRAG